MVVHRCYINFCGCNHLAERSGAISLLAEEPFRTVQNFLFRVNHTNDSIE